MAEIFVMGHKNQDTDATCAAIGMASLLTLEGKGEVLPVISDKPNKETQYVLDRFGVAEPKFLSDAGSVEKVFLVDFNEEIQSPIAFSNIAIEGLVDHHKLSITINRDYPILFRVEPLGSSCSIVAKIYFEREINISKEIASILIAGIVSDTLNFTSPTTTKEDKRIVSRLNEIASLNIDELASAMFEAKSNLDGISMEEIVSIDYKEFQFGGHKAAIAVFETVNAKPLLEREDEIRVELKALKEKNGLSVAYFGIVDIVNSKTTMIVISPAEEEMIKRAFPGHEVLNGKMELEGVVSRKKQIVPEFSKNII